MRGLKTWDHVAEEENCLGPVWDLVEASLPEGAASWDRCCACEGSTSEADWSPKHTPLVSRDSCVWFLQWCWQDLRWERALQEPPLALRPIWGGLIFDGAGAILTSSPEQRLSMLQSLQHVSPGPIPPARLGGFLLACRVSCPHPPCKHRHTAC